MRIWYCMNCLAAGVTCEVSGCRKKPTACPYGFPDADWHDAMEGFE